MPVLTEGAEVDRYRIEAPLGKGGMGEVYRAYDPRLRRHVALKVLIGEVTEDGAPRPELVARLLREARVAATLVHPNIVAIFDVGEAGGTPYIAMELVQGKALREYVGDARIRTPQKVRWLVEVARGLGAAHRAGVIHRDVKPANIIISDDDRAKLVDFGIAKRSPPAVQADGAPSSFRTLEGKVLGTPRYMAPEQLDGHAVDARCDQYAWGVVAYELLAGRRPDTPPSDIGEIVPDLPPGVAALVMRALARSPGDRYPSMDEIVACLDVAWSRKHLADVSATASPFRESSLDTTLVEGSAPPPIPRSPSKRSLSWVLFVAFAVALPLAVLAGRPRHFGAAPLVLGTAPATSPTAAPTRLLDLPVPASTSREALAAYEEGLRAYRDGVNDGFKSFDRALALDPSLAEAHLRKAMFLFHGSGLENQGLTLEAYRGALAGRERLSPRDRGVVDALEAVLLRQPVDWTACEEALRALTAKYPMDADLAEFLGSVLLTDGKLAEGDAAIGRALLLDPLDILSWLARIDAQQSAGDLTAAEASSRACLAASPRATACVESLIALDSIRGDCAGVEALARRHIATSPDDVWGYIDLFDAELALQEPIATLDTTLGLLVAHAEPAARAEASIRFAWDRAVSSGDFTAAEKLLGDYGKLALKDGDVAGLLATDKYRTRLALEVGDLRAAGRAANAFLERTAALAPPNAFTDDAMFRDAAPWAVMIARRAGLVSAEAARARRDAWVRRWESRLSGRSQAVVWLSGYALPAETREEADEALAHVPSDLHRLLGGSFLEPETIGRTYLLAGRVDEALPFLENAAAQCSMRKFPFGIMRATYLLGLAREAKGDHDGACKAYEPVISRWAAARPRSVTATLAVERAHALGCGR